MNIIIYILAAFIILIILFLLYIRVRYRFWSLQPVFHFYDLYYWIFNVGIIRYELPQKNRYTNFNNIQTLVFEDVSKSFLKQFILLVQLNYLQNGENIFRPKETNIVPYFLGHNSKSFFSFYWEKDLLIDNKSGQTIEDKKLIGVMTSRPLHVNILAKKEGQFDVYYVDYLCVNKQSRKKGIAPQIIQTHEYNQSHSNKKISVSLFKREEELTGIIPLTVYKTYCFNMIKWTIPEILDARISLLTGDKQNMYYVYNFIKETENKWDITILPEISNLLELITSKNLFIKMLVINTNIEAVYIFRKTCTFIEQNKEIISCIASINGYNLSDSEFIHGFKNALWSIIKDNKKNNNNTNDTNYFCYLSIEDVSDNHFIINNLCKKSFPIIVSPTAYFFYNFAYSPFKSNKVLIVC